MIRRLILYAAVFMIILFVAMFIYRYHFEFNNAKVKALLKEEADKFGANSKQVYAILHESVEHILKSADLTNQVRIYARYNKLPKEQVLVDAAVAEAQRYKYIN